MMSDFPRQANMEGKKMVSTAVKKKKDSGGHREQSVIHLIGIYL